MAPESKEGDAQVDSQASHSSPPATDDPKVPPDANDEVSSEDDAPETAIDGAGTSEMSKKKAKKKKKKKKKIAIPISDHSSPNVPQKKITPQQLALLLDANPALRAEMSDMTTEQVEAALAKMNLADVLTGVATSGRNVKDMASYKFWSTQPVPKLDEERGAREGLEDGPIQRIDVERVKKEPDALPDGFEWVLMDLTNATELEEVYELLSAHYVEDAEAMFRFRYSASFLQWALMAPGWRRDWHIGVRATQSGKLVAFISGIPVALRVRQKVLQCSEINFLCVHRKLRSKRLAPTLIKEVTRRCYLTNIFQAIYTAGVVLPTPVSSCRYFHRCLDWEKLNDVGFSHLPPNTSVIRQKAKFRLPDKTELEGLRPMEKKDCNQVLSLLKRYMERFDLAQVFTKTEVEHWLLHDATLAEDDRIVWTHVVEDPKTHKITDFFSFYRLASTVIGDKQNRVVNAAYLYYYATEAAFDEDESALKKRLNVLMRDALIVAKQNKFDVCNALTLLDNPLFLEEQKFGPGDGQLHYYLFNYRTDRIIGGVNANNAPDERFMGGVGMVML